MVEGQAATFTVDAFGDHVFTAASKACARHGIAIRLAAAGKRDGQFTKIVQRVPVKIVSTIMIR